MATSERQWYVKVRDRVHGPFSSKQLKQLAALGKISPDTLVRLGDDGNWLPAAKVKGLFVEMKSPVPAGLSGRLPPVSESSTQSCTAVSTRSEQLSQPILVPIAAPTSQVRIACRFCGEEILASAIKCKHCNEFLDGRPRDNQPQAMASGMPAPNITVAVNQQTQVVMQAKRWSPLVAMLLSFFIPGLGQLYKGQLLNGFVWFVVVAGGYFLLVIPGLALHLCCIVGAGMGDPYR